jgi:hypothetical protein
VTIRDDQASRRSASASTLASCCRDGLRDSICFQKTFSFWNCRGAHPKLCVLSTVDFAASPRRDETTTIVLALVRKAMAAAAGYGVPSTTTRVATTLAASIG